MENSNEKQKVDVYQMVTDRVIELLHQGVVPWKQTWKSKGLPHNLISKKAYRGINVFLLGTLGYERNYFLTYKQLKAMGGVVKQGEEPHLVFYWKWMQASEKATDEDAKKPFLRYYRVYNVAQCDNIPNEAIPAKLIINDPIGVCEQIIMEMPDCPDISFAEDMPFYNVKRDIVNVPPIDCFDSSEAYYETVFHEFCHATGHVSRLNRKELMENETTFKYRYSVEELTAELGACYLKCIAGIDSQFDTNASYIDGWLKVLRGNNRFIVYASTQAQKAVDFILNVNWTEAVTDDVSFAESLETEDHNER